MHENFVNDHEICFSVHEIEIEIETYAKCSWVADKGQLKKVLCVLNLFFKMTLDNLGL